MTFKSLSECTKLEVLKIFDATKLHCIAHLSSCTRLKTLILTGSRVTDLTPLSSLPLLERLDLSLDAEYDWSLLKRDLSPLCQCLNLKRLNIGGILGIKDLSPLSKCPELEELGIQNMFQITNLSFFEDGFTKLKVLDISRLLLLTDLTPLTKLPNLEELDCRFISLSTSLLPLARCLKLRHLACSKCARDRKKLMKELRNKINLRIVAYNDYC